MTKYTHSCFTQLLSVLRPANISDLGLLNTALAIFKDDNCATIPCLGQVQNLLRADCHKIIDPVQNREAKNHTLSSGMSPYRPCKGVPSKGGGEGGLKYAKGRYVSILGTYQGMI